MPHCHIHASLGVEVAKVTERGYRSHLLMGADKVLEEHMGPEIPLQPFLEIQPAVAS